MDKFPFIYVISVLLYISSIKLVNSQIPQVTITQTDPEIAYGKTIIARRDQDVTLSCFVENHIPGIFVIWERTKQNTQQTLPIATDLDLQDNINYGIEKPTTYTWRLRIRSVSVDDDGTYSCFLQIAHQRKVIANVTLVVYVPPTIDTAVSSYDMTVNEGEEVELTCNATGRPTPSVMWMRQGNALLPIRLERVMSSVMKVPAIRAEHRGVYKCIASHAYDSTVRNINVNVRFKPVIRVAYPQLTQKEGYVIELQCLVTANPAPDEAQLAWYKGTSRISRSSDRYHVQTLRGAFNQLTYELIINGVQKSDYGEYRCDVRNGIGLSSATVRLSKSSRPMNSVKLGRPVAGAASVLANFLLISALFLAVTCLKLRS